MTNMFGPGEKVLACPVGAFGARFAEIARTWGVDVEFSVTQYGKGVDPQALKARLDADTKKRDQGRDPHAQRDVDRRSERPGPARRFDSRARRVSLVDSVSGLAASEFTMDAWGFDVVFAASQKALGVPPGMAMVAVSPRAWEKMNTSDRRATISICKSDRLPS